MVAWIALALSALSLVYSVWNEVTKRRLQYEARFVHSIAERDEDADWDAARELTLENVGSGNAHDVVLVFEYDPTSVGFGDFKWSKIAAGASVTQMPTAALPDELSMMVVGHQLRDRSPWWRREILIATVYWSTPMGKARRQRITRSRRSMRW
ncbi:hypothetical protein BIV02_01035 [Curtobacterium sp. MMLR14_014]|jgi:hypothetical protein|uniref:hypothetical protein n=1 Tax=unclassified Curtobacterium TaxID=257496 RepID=UPI0008F8B09C|nr:MULTISPECIES: hypothetical protein [unclassified Curtobacterium]OII34531.1 hypothetical protein BIU91_16120 [Curtobacterium sp. MMLR14_002]OII44775.1 hypothetical protein BIV02_01035 [Curtobacterium sp. MMLR14_014]